MQSKKVFKVIGIIAFVLIAVLCGKLVGDLIVQKYIAIPTSALFKEADLLDNEDSIIANYKSGKINFENLKQSDASQVAVIAFFNCYQKDYFKIDFLGRVEASIATQTLSGSLVKNGNTCTRIEISEGLKQVANKIVSDLTKETSSVVHGKVKNGSPEFTSAVENISFADYKKKYGVNPKVVYNYIISSKTILTSKLTKTNNGAKFELTLDPQKSVINYAKSIDCNSGMGEPTFKFINFNFEIDKNFNFLNYNVQEEYTIKYGVEVQCKSQITSTFTYK